MGSREAVKENSERLIKVISISIESGKSRSREHDNAQYHRIWERVRDEHERNLKENENRTKTDMIESDHFSRSSTNPKLLHYRYTSSYPTFFNDERVIAAD